MIRHKYHVKRLKYHQGNCFFIFLILKRQNSNYIAVVNSKMCIVNLSPLNFIAFLLYIYIANESIRI